MQPHTLQVAKSAKDAATKANVPGASLLAGGTNLIDHMKTGVVRPSKLVDLSDLPLREIEDLGDVIRYGALVTNTHAAEHALTHRFVPLVAMTIVKGATQQIRNMASVAGNLFQGVRCPYFADFGAACVRRDGTGGCDAIGGFDRMNAVFGVSEMCTAAHPSDFAVSLAAYDAVINVTGPSGTRRLPFSELLRQPGSTPWKTHNLEQGELVTSVDVPKSGGAKHSSYVKIRDRRSYAFATLSVAVSLTMNDGSITDARIAAGGVGTVPWRFKQLEVALQGQPADQAVFETICARSIEGATPGTQNGFKLDLLPKAMLRALLNAITGTPSDPTFYP